jgi:hypothetical protein
MSTCKRIKPDPYLIPDKKSTQKLINDLNIRLETIKLLDKNRNKPS